MTSKPTHSPFGSRAVDWFAAAALLVVALVPCLGAGGAQQLPAATGHITYKATGMMNGKMALAWIDHGKKFRQSMKVQAGNNTVETWSICDGKSVYVSQPGGAKVVLRMKLPKEALAGQTLGMGALMPGKGGGAAKLGSPVGKASILGKPCRIYQKDKMKLWMWQGLPLRMEMAPGNGPSFSLVATQIEMAPKFAKGTFQVPAGYQIQDFDMSKMRIPGAPGPR